MARVAPRKLPQHPESMNTTTDQIKALLAESTQRAKSATKGPWIAGIDSAFRGFGLHAVTHAAGAIACGTSATNTTFIAAARTDLPARDRALLIAVDFIVEQREQWSPSPAYDAILAAILAAINGALTVAGTEPGGAQP